MPFEESIFTEDIEALDEDFEAFDEADEAFEDDFSEAWSDKKKKGQYRGPAGSTGASTRNSFRAIGNQRPQQTTITTPAGKMNVPLAGVATKKDLGKLVNGVSDDLKKNSTAIQSINKSLSAADKNIAAKNTDLEKRLKSVQLSQLAGIVIAPRLTSITFGDVAADGSMPVVSAKYNSIIPLLLAVALPLVMNATKGSGIGATLLPVIVIFVFAVISEGSSGDGTFNFSNIFQDPTMLIVLAIVALPLIDSKLFG
jgi:hypothetical protein